MKPVVKILYTEPVAFLAVLCGVTALLAKEGLIATWIPLVALAISAGIQRALVEPVGKENSDG